jgi:hypothetical protein
MSAADIAKAVLDIQRRDGVCTPAAFVAEAAAPDSPLHSLFDWDDVVEAQRWREHYARILIGRVRISLHDDDRVPAHVHVMIRKGGKRIEGYVPVEVAMSNSTMRAQVFREARAGLNGWRNRLTAFTEASEAVHLLGKAIEALRPEEEGS